MLSDVLGNVGSAVQQATREFHAQGVRHVFSVAISACKVERMAGIRGIRPPANST